jgi:ribosome biogenesis protein Tsr3
MVGNGRPRVLLVEGEEDKRVIPYLIEANGIDWGKPKDPSVYIEAYGGIEVMLEPDEIETRLDASGLDA